MSFNLPLLTAIQEVAEEMSLESADGWLRRALQAIPGCPRPIRAPCATVSPVASASVRCPVQRYRCSGNLTLLERPRAYVHLPTASLQLVYDMSLELPRDARQ